MRTTVLDAATVTRFWSHVDTSGGPGSCWKWTGAVMHKGYGHFGVSATRTVRAHRLAFEMSTGASIAQGHQIDHLCHTRACVNPAHLEQVSPATNQQRRSGANGNSRSGVRGVHFDKSRGMWSAETRVNGVRRRGRFKTKEEAADAVSTWRLEMGSGTVK